MPIDTNDAFGKPFQRAIIERSEDEEIVFGTFGSGCVNTFSRKHIKELQEIARDDNRRVEDRKTALEKLQRWSDQGSKASSEALRELGFGSRVLLHCLLEHDTAGDPMTALRWSRCTTIARLL